MHVRKIGDGSGVTVKDTSVGEVAHAFEKVKLDVPCQLLSGVIGSAVFGLAFLAVAGALFIMALRGLSSPVTSRQGNLYGIVGMVIAIGVTVATPGVVSPFLIVAGLIVGGAIGAAVGTANGILGVDRRERFRIYALGERRPSVALAGPVRVGTVLPEDGIVFGGDTLFSVGCGKLLEGEVTMTRNFTLQDDEVQRGWVLTCQAVSSSPRVVVSVDER